MMQRIWDLLQPIRDRRAIALTMVVLCSWVACGLVACQRPTSTPVRPVTIIDTEGEHPHAGVTIQPETTDPAPQMVTATPNPSRTPRPTRTVTPTATAVTTTPEATPAWANPQQALEEISLPSHWVTDVDLTGSVTVTHPVEWTVSEQGMHELALMPPGQAWAKVRFVDEPLNVNAAGEGLERLAGQMREIEASRNIVVRVDQTLRQDPVKAALVSLYTRDPQRRQLLCHVVHVWLPLEDGRHIYGIVGRYESVIPAITAEELDTLLHILVATAQKSVR